mmetsp:Transcript_41440/g.125476  ORF Transcript_41440/g.125476 Transcript_41440/m.125476 type:complete len:80 (-) Transcript_41440:99-338(-)
MGLLSRNGRVLLVGMSIPPVIFKVSFQERIDGSASPKLKRQQGALLCLALEMRPSWVAAGANFSNYVKAAMSKSRVSNH